MLTPQRPVISVEAEVMGNIRAQAIGGHTVADLHVPDGLLRRITDRIIRESFEERHRIVVADGTVPAGSDMTAPIAVEPGATAGNAPFVIARAELDPAMRAYRAALPETRVERRGFRAPILGDPRRPVVTLAHGSESSARAGDHIARRLALDGLLATTAAAIGILGAERFLTPTDERMNELDGIGIPVDLLACFRAGDAQTALGTIASLARLASSARDPASLKRSLAKTEFRFIPSCPGFAAASESGELAPAVFRVQLPGGEYWGGIGAGGGLDVLRQLVEALPRARFVVSVEEKHLPGFGKAAAAWQGVMRDRVVAVVESLPVAQWAQDNGKAGVAGGEAVVLVPRYASRSEDAPTFVPGETFLADGLRSAGIRVVQSPLLFQGGNLMTITDPTSGERLLLIGEAEVDRHLGLGLTPEQTLSAFKTEFGVDRCEVLPAVSFHIDYEISIRAVGAGLVALVPDERAAAGLVVRCALEACVRAGVVDGSGAAAAQQDLAAGSPMRAVSILGEVLSAKASRPGHVPASVAEIFSASAADSGVGNTHRILAAMDLFAAITAAPSTLPADRHARAYLQSLTRRLADRRLLARRLEQLRFRVIPVPSFGEGRRAITAINGIHARGMYLMPSYGGVFAPLDQASMSAIQAAVGQEVRVIPILCGESQRRAGALHCAVMAIPS